MGNWRPLHIRDDINNKHVHMTFDLAGSISYIFLTNDKVFEISVFFVLF